MRLYISWLINLNTSNLIIFYLLFMGYSQVYLFIFIISNGQWPKRFPPDYSREVTNNNNKKMFYFFFKKKSKVFKIVDSLYFHLKQLTKKIFYFYFFSLPLFKCTLHPIIYSFSISFKYYFFYFIFQTYTCSLMKEREREKINKK